MATVRLLDLVLVVVVMVVMDHSFKKLSKSKKSPALEHAFIFLRLAFTDMRIETKAAYFLGK